MSQHTYAERHERLGILMEMDMRKRHDFELASLIDDGANNLERNLWDLAAEIVDPDFQGPAAEAREFSNLAACNFRVGRTEFGFGRRQFRGPAIHRAETDTGAVPERFVARVTAREPAPKPVLQPTLICSQRMDVADATHRQVAQLGVDALQGVKALLVGHAIRNREMCVRIRQQRDRCSFGSLRRSSRTFWPNGPDLSG